MPIGCGLAVFDQVDSTNSEALRRGGDEAPLWVWAKAQTRGRGRQGRVWESQHGNLYASLLLPVSFSPALTPQISFVTALAVHDAIAQLLGGREAASQLRLKWPNDVLLGGAKIAGILLESASGNSSHPVVAIGCGINLAHHPDLTGRQATSLGAHGVEVSAGDALSTLAAAMQLRLAEWNDGQGFAAIREDWLLRASGLGERIEVRLPMSSSTGIFSHIDEQGALILKLDDGRKQRITAGDVFTSGESFS